MSVQNGPIWHKDIETLKNISCWRPVCLFTTKMKRAYLELHIAVILLGFTAILGKLITIDAVPLVWWRVLITAASLLVFSSVRNGFTELPRKLRFQYLATGGLLAVHWILFFLSIKLANVSVALVAFSTTTFFTAISEPLVVGGRIQKYEVFLGVLIVPAMALIVSELDLSLHLGLWVGLISAVAIAVFTSITKKMITKAGPLQITFYQMVGAFFFISVFMPVLPGKFTDKIHIEGSDIIYILLLALMCTTLAYVLAIRSLRHLTAFASNLTISLEPIYGIILAILIFSEHESLSVTFYIGAAAILCAVFSYPVLRRRQNNKSKQDAGTA